MHHLWLWVLHVSGSDNVSGKWYGFWSGFGGDLGIVGALAAIPWMQYKRHNCRIRGCWRIGRHPYTDPEENVTRLLCHVHHPDVKHKQLTRGRMRQFQQRSGIYLGKRPGPG